MLWQSYVLAACQAVFVVALIPTLRNPAARILRRTSVTTAAALWVIAAMHGSLELWAAMVMSTSSAAVWTYLAIARPLQPAAPEPDEPPAVPA